MTSRPVYQVHLRWAVDGGLKGVALCLRPRGNGGRVDWSPFGEAPVWWVCQFALPCPEGFLKGHNE